MSFSFGGLGRGLGAAALGSEIGQNKGEGEFYRRQQQKQVDELRKQAILARKRETDPNKGTRDLYGRIAEDLIKVRSNPELAGFHADPANAAVTTNLEAAIKHAIGVSTGQIPVEQASRDLLAFHPIHPTPDPGATDGTTDPGLGTGGTPWGALGAGGTLDTGNTLGGTAGTPGGGSPLAAGGGADYLGPNSQPSPFDTVQANQPQLPLSPQAANLGSVRTAAFGPQNYGSLIPPTPLPGVLSGEASGGLPPYVPPPPPPDTQATPPAPAVTPPPAPPVDPQAEADAAAGFVPEPASPFETPKQRAARLQRDNVRRGLGTRATTAEVRNAYTRSRTTAQDFTNTNAPAVLGANQKLKGAQTRQANAAAALNEAMTPLRVAGAKKAIENVDSQIWSRGQAIDVARTRIKETVRHDKVTEGQGGQRLALEGQKLLNDESYRKRRLAQLDTALARQPANQEMANKRAVLNYYGGIIRSRESMGSFSTSPGAAAQLGAVSVDVQKLIGDMNQPVAGASGGATTPPAGGASSFKLGGGTPAPAATAGAQSAAKPGSLTPAQVAAVAGSIHDKSFAKHLKRLRQEDPAGAALFERGYQQVTGKPFRG